MPIVTQSPPDSKVFTTKELYEKTYPLVVPTWQRDFTWQPDDHVQKLIDDLSEFNSGADLHVGRYYLLGQVIVVPNHAGENEIVDGQQRLTTVYLMLLSLLNTFKTEGRVALNVQSNSVIYSSLISAVVDDDDNDVRLSLPFQDGTRVLRHLYLEGSNHRDQLGGELTASQENLLKVYDHFQSWVDTQLTDERSLTLYTKRLLNSVYFTRLGISDIPQAMDYFEKMNRRGLPLAAADLLKNFLFSQIDDSDFETLSRVWRTMATEVEKVSKRSLGSTEMFIKTLAIAQHYQKINGTDALLAYWKKELDTADKREMFRSSLIPTSRFYRGVAEGRLEGIDRPVLEKVRALGGTQHLAVLVAGRHLENLAYLADLLDRRFTLYTFANERTGAFESMIPKWCQQIAELSPTSSIDEILSASRHADGFMREDARESISLLIRGLNYQKNSTHRKLRFVLALCARTLDIEAAAEHHGQAFGFYLKTAKKLSPGFDLDHILGQKFLTDQTDDEKQAFNSIGALTPLFSSSHREQVHLTPSGKKNLYEQSPFVLTKSVTSVPSSATPRLRRVLEKVREIAPVDLENWTTESVALRTELIIQTFLSAIKVDDFIPQRR